MLCYVYQAYKALMKAFTEHNKVSKRDYKAVLVPNQK